MPNNIFGASYGRPNYFWPLQKVAISELPITTENARDIFTIDPQTGFYKSHRPGKLINDFNDLEAFQIYTIVAFTDIDLSSQGNTTGQGGLNTGGGIIGEEGTPGGIAPEEGNT